MHGNGIILIPIFIAIATILLVYLVGSIEQMFIFKTLGLSAGLAFIPIYSTYRILKEYKGRVYRRNWGMLFLSIFPILLIVIFTIFNFDFEQGNDIIDYIGQNIGSVFIIIILLIVIGVISAIVNFLLMYPLMYTKNLKIVFIVVFVSNLLTQFVFKSESTIYSLFSLFTLVFYITISYLNYSKVKSGEKRTVQKLDSATMSDKEIGVILSSRNKMLIQDVSFENNSESTNNNEESSEFYI